MSQDQEDRDARLRESREAAGYKNATDAAEAFGFNVVTYRSHENALRGIKPTVAKRYAKAYKISWSWLMSGKGAMTGPGIDAELMALPPDLSVTLIAAIRQMLAAVKHRGKI